MHGQQHIKTHTHVQTPARRRSRYLPNTQPTQETNIYALSADQHRDPSNQAPSDGRAIGIGFVNITQIKFRFKCVDSYAGYLYYTLVPHPQKAVPRPQ